MSNPAFSVPAQTAPSRVTEWTLPVEEARFELYARAVGVPLILLLAWLVSGSSVGALVLRTFAGMWLHELGHASASWFSGYSAVPLPWFTAWSEERSVVVTLMMLVGMGAGTAWGWVSKRQTITVLCALGLITTLFCRLGLSHDRARQFTLFAGDAGAMIYGSLLVLTFFARPSSKLVRDALRWGFLVFGACAFTDALRTWWECKKDYANLPFGLEDGHLSDASRLVDHYHWAESVLVNRYLAVGVGCLVVMMIAWWVAVLTQRSRLRRVMTGEV